MKASATSERSAVTPISGAQRRSNARAGGKSSDAGKTLRSVGMTKQVNATVPASGCSKAPAKQTVAVRAAADEPASKQTGVKPAPAGSGKPSRAAPAPKVAAAKPAQAGSAAGTGPKRPAPKADTAPAADAKAVRPVAAAPLRAAAKPGPKIAGSPPAAPQGAASVAIQTPPPAPIRAPVTKAPEPKAPELEAPEPKGPAIKPRETPKHEHTPIAAATPADAKPEDTKIQDVKIAEAKPAEPRPMNGSMSSRPAPLPRAPAKEENFVEGDYVVYPTHGVGKVEKIAVEDIAGHRLELIHITFEENRMTLRVPVAKARSAGLRKLATQAKFNEALAVLRGRARVKRTMWSRRAQEYEAKINSGDPIAIAEVVRDLHRNAGQPDQSFSERQIYESAMDRLAAELAALDATDKATAAIKLANFLKST